MTLKIKLVQESDLDVLTRHPETSDPADDLVAPPCPVTWPVVTRTEARVRARYHFEWQKRRLLGDPSLNFLKVVDDENGDDIVAVARWHFYPKGYDYESNKHWEMAQSTPLGRTNPSDNKSQTVETAEYPPSNFNLSLHNYILTMRDSFRPDWIPNGGPVWILMHLVTRPSQRRRGAAGMLVRWGQVQAQITGASVYLEAGIQGQPMYEKYGFQQVGATRRLDIRSYGAAVEEFTLANMRWSPVFTELHIPPAKAAKPLKAFL
ncbi:hypothetical protein S7711_05836 [Stachybotrys chartarum IBT 7711]|uniref:N-acetyltransferase domain-containing protein n=1 Tax=Stachybotrys chartarum (strain CBS 109288 / IBT 7711) TaxID=1280523 RepID=A0A084AM73_STACB|nr:hypothetical protein S7711_05836 [Stachybotrys chartarum IBT 7711]